MCEIGGLDDKSRIYDSDLAMRIFRAHLLIRFDGKIRITTKIILDLFESILKLLKFFVFHDELNMRATLQKVNEKLLYSFFGKVISLDL